MNDKDMFRAEREAKRFLSRVNEYRDSSAYEPDKRGCSFHPSSERATVKRASMDLTRALATMRNPK